MNRSVGAAMLAAAVIVGMAPAHADVNNPAINGTFTATSNGEWARTNDSYHDEASIHSTWTIATSCVNPVQCAGTVTSDQGWTAKIVHVPGMWKVIRELPGWQTCADGTASTGRQVFTFYPVGLDMSLVVDANSTTYSGEDQTIGLSGACGKSWPLNISMPFKLVKIG